jgi:hypothetical protein
MAGRARGTARKPEKMADLARALQGRFTSLLAPRTRRRAACCPAMSRKPSEARQPRAPATTRSRPPNRPPVTTRPAATPPASPDGTRFRVSRRGLISCAESCWRIPAWPVLNLVRGQPMAAAAATTSSTTAVMSASVVR